MENKNIEISNAEYILNLLFKKLSEQEKEIMGYINEAMTPNERYRHGDDIFNHILSPQGTIAEIKMRMIAEGRKNL
jgi:hypothetical protein